MNDRARLMQAFALAARVDARATSPNPRVGCVLVKGGRVLGRGAHHGYGKPHAEPTALARARSAKGATAFVTMEPCFPYPGKRNPSCAETLVKAGVRRVVCGSLDPNPKVRGRGVAYLRRRGVAVTVLPVPEAEALNRGFFSRMSRGRPWVILKTALSLDGKAAAENGRSRWVTGPAARRLVHAWRAECDAVLVGAGTLRADDPALTAHGAGKDPVRVILAGRKPLPKRAKAYPALVYRSIKPMLSDLSKRGIGTLFVEGGPKVHASFLKAGLVDEARVFIAPKLLAGSKDPNAGKLSLTLKKVGDDFLFSGTL
ncbi:MAG: bifunctional diaminohydroxyphosphoribosylaminopyrimidine deaminase/5-amino-6-(5-phosphoribosylamino)uracil reductase RibD [Elusimicrobiota bacterium]|nr:bifunctional diaminohydroxyphosphoribosylaminopyrimidine deaminase/5-amino-6-(5-phosphoribosylamino)uracil reductase RibD [Elusimicrobiota bacterium]